MEIKHMKRIIMPVLMLFLLSNLAVANDVGYSYMYALEKNGDLVNIVWEDIGLVVYTGNLEPKTHSWHLYDVSGRKLLSSEFGFPEYKYLERDDSCLSENLIDNIPGCVSLPNVIKEEKPVAYIYAPYHPLGSHISILDVNNVERLIISVKKYSDYCGNGICSDTESYLTCYSDCGTRGMLFLSDFNQEFHAYNTKIESSEDIVVYSSFGKCQNEEGDCIEYDESNNIMNVFVRESSSIDISTDKIYVYNVHFSSGNGQLNINSGTSHMMISPGNMKNSFTDWSDLPVVNSNYLENGVRCTDKFDPRNSNQLIRVCR